MKRIYLSLLILSILVLPLILAEQSSLGIFKVNDCISLKQTCQNCSYINISSVTYPNSTQALGQVVMTKIGTEFNYTFCKTDVLGTYTVNGYGDDDGTKEIFIYDFNITSTGNSKSWVLLLFLYGLAIIILFFSIIADEEFFVYISGILFLIAGIYVMINGLDYVSDWYTRTISYVSLGFGFLFTLGAYIFNKFSLRGNEESIED